MPTARSNYAVATMNGNIYVAGGMVDDIRMRTVECYNPTSNVWTTKCPMNLARANFALVESQGNLYAMGDERHIERFNHYRNEWSVV